MYTPPDGYLNNPFIYEYENDNNYLHPPHRTIGKFNMIKQWLKKIFCCKIDY